MADESLIGKQLDSFTFPVERGKIREFATSLLDDDPVFSDPEAARAVGFDAIPAPLTFSVASAHWREAENVETLGLDLRRVLHGEVEWEYLRPLVAGDELTAVRRVADVTKREGKRGGVMTFVVVETEYRDAAGEPVVRQRDTIIETGGG